MVTDGLRGAMSIMFVIMLVAVVALGSGVTTYAYFSDSHSTDKAQVTIASQGGGGDDPGPPGNKAFHDTNGDGVYQDNEPTYNANDLRDFQNDSVDLVVPSDVGTVSRNGNGNISVTAASITSSVSFDAGNGGVELMANSGDISLSGQSVNGDTGQVSITATGDINLSGSTISALNDGVSITTDGQLNMNDATITSGDGDISSAAQSISARHAELNPQNGGTILTATENGGGALDALGAEMSGGNAGITLETVGAMNLNATTLDSQNGDAAADLDLSNTRLDINGAEIADSDSTLVYEPNVTVRGTPAAGCAVVNSWTNSICP